MKILCTFLLLGVFMFGSNKPVDMFPKLPELSLAELEKVDTILQKKKLLWMFAQLNNNVVVFELSQGVQGLLKQKLLRYSMNLTTRKDGSIALLYFYTDDGFMDDFFVLSVDLDKELCTDARWIRDPMRSLYDDYSSRMITNEELTFFNDSFGLGLEKLIIHNTLSIFYDEDSLLWHFSRNTGHAHSSFTLHSVTKERIEGPDMHYIPSPRPRGIPDDDEEDLELLPSSLDTYKDYLSPVRYEKAFDMPKLTKNIELNSKDEDYINKSLTLRDYDIWKSGLKGLREDFNIGRVEDETLYHLKLSPNIPAKLETSLRIDKHSNVIFEPLQIPNGKELSEVELQKVDAILKTHKTTTMSMPNNNICVTFNLTQGHKGLLTQELPVDLNDKSPLIKINTRLYDDIAVLYYSKKEDGDAYVAIWVNLKTQSFEGMKRLSLPMDDGHWFSPKDVSFFDKHLQVSNFEKLLLGFTVFLHLDKATNLWNFHIMSPESFGGDFEFTMDAKTGSLSDSYRLHTFMTPIPDPAYLPSIYGNLPKVEVLVFPTFKGDERDLSVEDKLYLDEVLKRTVGTANERGFSAYEENFIITRIPDKKAYTLLLSPKNRPELEVMLSVDELGISHDILTLKKAAKLSSKQFKEIDAILQKEEKLYLSTPSNHHLHVLNVAKGYKEIVKQNIDPYLSTEKFKYKLTSGIYGDVALLCYTQKSSLDTFIVALDLKKKEVLEANWFSLPLSDSFYLSKASVELIDSYLENNTVDFLSETMTSIEGIRQYDILTLSQSPKSWWFSITPKENAGYSVAFSMNKADGHIGAPMISNIDRGPQ